MFYSSIFDPELIIYEILVMQCIFYIILSLWLLIFHLTLASSLTLDMILSSSYMSFSYATAHHPSTLNTYITILSTLLTSPFIAFGLLLIVGRSKKCLDHVATIHILHVLFCTLFTRFPLHIEYWLTHIITATISTLVGEYLCIQREMATIQRTDDSSGSGSSKMNERIKSSDKQQQQVELSIMNGNHDNIDNEAGHDEHDRLLMSNGNHHISNSNNTTNESSNNIGIPSSSSLPRHTSTQSVEDIDIELGISNTKLRTGVARPLLISV